MFKVFKNTIEINEIISKFKNGKKLKILLIYSIHPTGKTITLPEWIKEAIRLYYSDYIEVFACGPSNEIPIPDGTDFYVKVNEVIKEKNIDILIDIEGGAVNLDFMFRRFPIGINIPKIFWAIDTHQFLSLQKVKAKYFDIVFSAQKNAVKELGNNAYWLPAGASIYDEDYGFERDINCAFIGNVIPNLHKTRKELIDFLKVNIPGFGFFSNVFLENKARLASRIKIMVNQSLKNDINFRVFESMACGCMLITDKIINNGMEDLFQDGKDLVMFNSREDLKKKIQYYISHEQERKDIARSGQEKVLKYFTHEKIFKYMMNVVFEKILNNNKEIPVMSKKEKSQVENKCWCGGDIKNSIHLAYNQCINCDTFILKNVFPEEEIKRFYGFKEYWHEYQIQISHHPPIEIRAINDIKDRVPAWFKTLKKYKNKINNIFEIGCAPGSFLKYCLDNGIKNIAGIEVDMDTCKFIEENFGFPRKSIISGLFPEVNMKRKFDVVCGFDLIEHIQDPIKAMKKVKSLLKKDGIFFFQTPCYRGENEQWEQFRTDEHVFLYTENGFRKLLDVADLKVIDIIPGYFRDDMFVIGGLK